MDEPLLPVDEERTAPDPDATYRLRTQASVRRGMAGEGIQASRPSYLQSLRAGSVVSLRLEGGLERDVADEDSQGPGEEEIKTPTSRVSKFDPLEELAKSGKLARVEVRMRGYSYVVPVWADAPSIKTVTNQSPCYVGTEFVKNVGELITGQRRVRVNRGIIYVFVCTSILTGSSSFVLLAWESVETSAAITRRRRSSRTSTSCSSRGRRIWSWGRRGVVRGSSFFSGGDSLALLISLLHHIFGSHFIIRLLFIIFSAIQARRVCSRRLRVC